jgi:hypothetical protein
MDTFTRTTLFLVVAVALLGCSNRSPGSARATTGVMAGNAGIGVGNGASRGLLNGYLSTQHEKSKQQAYQQSDMQQHKQGVKQPPPWQ